MKWWRIAVGVVSNAMKASLAVELKLLTMAMGRHLMQRLTTFATDAWSTTAVPAETKITAIFLSIVEGVKETIVCAVSRCLDVMTVINTIVRHVKSV